MIACLKVPDNFSWKLEDKPEDKPEESPKTSPIKHRDVTLSLKHFDNEQFLKLRNLMETQVKRRRDTPTLKRLLVKDSSDSPATAIVHGSVMQFQRFTKMN